MNALEVRATVADVIQKELDAARSVPVVMSMPPLEGDVEKLACEIVNFRYVRILEVLLESLPRIQSSGFVPAEERLFVETLLASLQRHEVVVL